MKKSFLILVLIGLVLTSLSSCKRSELTDPSWEGPAGFYIMLDGSASPAVLFIDGNENLSTIRARVTTSAGAPIANALIFFEQLNDGYGEVAWGRFENGAATISKVTNANGEASVAFFSPVLFYSHNMYIHALMQVNDRAYAYYAYSSIPQDFISIGLINAGAAATSDKI
jgi:hypothetical protein